MSSHKPNRLVLESSPYLQQHAHNPVDWYPWGEEALRAARDRDRPILLSIGYSACHWCHVMAHECFENEEIAALMNEHFINVKVDREERPDLDMLYMNFVQMTTGSGGWPLTVFLTPDQVPFFGGTYFPPEDRLGRPGFRRLLQSIVQLYRNERGQLEAGRSLVIHSLERVGQSESGVGRELSLTLLDEAYRRLESTFDDRHGGFGEAPKFPNSMCLAFLLRYHKRTGDRRALEMVCRSLEEMARGGIYDHLGGGFHRYSVDDRWLVPHFEKMLYDNALLARLYLEAYQATQDGFYREVAEQTLSYVERDMRDVAGGFYSAEDADSEGEEGKHYIWARAEVEEALGDDRTAQLFCDFFDVTPEGNFESRNILHARVDLATYARVKGIGLGRLQNILTAGRRRLFELRQKRVRPGTDDKVLSGWNGLVLTAFAEAAYVLDNPHYLQVAEQCATFLTSHMWAGDRLLRSWKGGRARIPACLEDYALVTEGLISLYQATGAIQWLRQARRLTEAVYDLFHDSEQGDFYFTAVDQESLIVRPRNHVDHAIPSGNSVTCFNLLRLARLLAVNRYQETAEVLLRRVAVSVSKNPLAFGYWLQALDFYWGPVQEIVIVGPGPDRDRLTALLRGTYLPNQVRVLLDPTQPEVAHEIPWLAGKTAIEGRAAVYVCQDYTCLRPATTEEELEQILTAGGSRDRS